MTSERPPQSKIVNVAVVLLLALMAVLAGGAARRESITFDELSHIAAGTSYIQKLDLRLNMEHPPLSKILVGIPLALRGAKADYNHVSWTFSDQGFFKQYIGQWVFGHYFIATWNDPVSTVWWARLSMLAVTLLLGVTLYVYGKRLTTPRGGLLCLCAFATMPAFITFGPLALSDTVVTLYCLVTMWAFADMWKAPSRGKVVKFGVVLGAALLSKFSAGLLFFCFLVFILSLRYWQLPGMPSDKAELRAWRRRRWSALIKGTLLAALLVYFTYLIFSWNQPTASFSVIPNFPASPFLRRMLMPIWIFLQGFLTFLVTASRPTFILGHAYPHGVWFYISDRFHAEIAACLSCFAAFELYYPAGDEITFTAGLFSGARGDGTTLARGMDFSVHLFCCVCSKPADHQHSSFSDAAGSHYSAACTTTKNAGSASQFGMAGRAAECLAYDRVGSSLDSSGYPHLSALHAFFKQLKHGAS